jgi:WD40 repeat protein
MTNTKGGRPRSSIQSSTTAADMRHRLHGVATCVAALSLWAAARSMAGGRPEVVLQHGATAAFQYEVSFSGDGKLLAVAGSDTIAVWNVRSRRLLRTLPASHARNVALSGDGRLLASITPAALVLRHTLSYSDPDELPFADALFVACSIDGRFVAVARAEEVTIVRVSDSAEIRTLRLRAPPTALSFSSKGDHFATGDAAGTLTIARTVETADEVRVAVGSGITALSFAPNDTQIAVATAGRDVRVIARQDRRQLRVLPLTGPTAAVAIAWGPTRLTALTAVGHVSTWNGDLTPASDGDVRLPTNFLSGQTASDQPLAITRDGERIAAGAGFGEITLVDAATMKIAGLLVPVDTAVRALSVSRAGLLLAVGAGQSLLVWDLSRGDVTRAVQLNERIEGLAFSRDGSSLGVATRREVALWDTTRWTERRVARARSPIAFSADGTFAAATSTSAVALLDPLSGRTTLVHRGFFRRLSIAFSADGHLVASGSNGGLSVTDLRTGEEKTYGGATDGGMSTVGLSGDGRYFVAGGLDRVVIREMATVARFVPSSRSSARWARLRSTTATLCSLRRV